MNVITLPPEDMQAAIKGWLSVRGRTPLLVFPTNIAADSWSDWAACHPEESGVRAVALETFTAWDRFKGRFLDTKMQDRSSIPALLRKLFVRDLIHRNNTQERMFTKILPQDPADGPASYAFTDWLSQILPSLRLWYEKYSARPPRAADEEDGDYLRLYQAYSGFLADNALFEPSWERPAFTDGDTPVVLIYPELLEDWADYEDIFKDAANVTAVRLPDGRAAARAYRFSNSRTELRRLLLHLRDLHHTRHVPWTDIAVSVPDIETYRPYLIREFARYCVPCNMRSGLPLTTSSAGSLFQQIADCHASGFSYGAVRAALQNEYVPWEPEYAALKESLIREGSRLRCLCSYTEPGGGAAVDSWERSLSAVPTDARELAFYRLFKQDVTALCRARSFKGIRTAWMTFKRRYLREQDFTEEADRILGRCISELNDLIDIEENYITRLNLHAGPCYSFFLSELNGKIYKPQESIDGVAVFPYKLAAAARYPYQFVIDASQQNLGIQYQPLSFLNAQKRTLLLGMADRDVSQAFIALYSKCPGTDGTEVPFSYSEETFQGFAIAHTALTVLDGTADSGYEELEAGDFLRAERRDMLAGTIPAAPAFTPSMQRSFCAWRERTAGFGTAAPYRAARPLADRVSALLVTSRNKPYYGLPDGSGEAIKLSQSDLQNCYPCPRRWILATVLGIQEDTLDTDLMQRSDMGNIHHKMLEQFMRDRAARGLPLPVTQADGRFPPAEEDECQALLLEFARAAITDPSLGLTESALVQAALLSQTRQLARTVLAFLHRLCHAPDRPDPDRLNSRTALKGFGGFRVRGAELRLSAPSGIDGLVYFGSIDCLLYEQGHGARNRYAIIDYKTSSASLPSSADSVPAADGTLGDFQMPLYVRLVEANEIAVPEEEDVEAAYFYAIRDAGAVRVIDDYVGRPKPKKGEAASGPERPKSHKEYARAVAPALAGYAADFARRVAHNDFEAAGRPCTPRGALANVMPWRDCAGCRFRGVCRTTFTIGRKTLAFRTGD